MTFLQYLQTIHAFTTPANEWVAERLIRHAPAYVRLATLDFGYVEQRFSEKDGSEYRLTERGYKNMKNDELMLSMDT